MYNILQWELPNHLLSLSVCVSLSLVLRLFSSFVPHCVALRWNEIFTCSLIFLCVANDIVGFHSAGFATRKWKLCDFCFLLAFFAIVLCSLLLLLPFIWLPTFFIYQMRKLCVCRIVHVYCFVSAITKRTTQTEQFTKMHLETLAHFIPNKVVRTAWKLYFTINILFLFSSFCCVFLGDLLCE